MSSISIKRLNQSKYSWLKNSIFYKSLDLSDENEILNLEYCSKYTKDIKKYLRVINLWGIEYFPKEFLNLYYKIKPLKEITELVEVTKSEFYEFLLESLFVDDIIHWTILKEQVQFLKNLYKEDFYFSRENLTLSLNNFEILKHLLENGMKPDEDLLLDASYKDIKFFKYVHEKMGKCKLGHNYFLYFYNDKDEKENYIRENIDYDDIFSYINIEFENHYTRTTGFKMYGWHENCLMSKK